MEVMILGSGSGLPSLSKHLSSILVRSDNGLFLLDCGDGCSHLLLEQDVKADDLDAVLISHYHPDHVSGIFMLIQMLYLSGRTKPLDVFLPERVEDFLGILRMFYTFPQKFAFPLTLHEITDVPKHYPHISCMVNDHLHGYEPIIKSLALSNGMMAYSIRISGASGDFVYSSDIGTTDSIKDLILGANTLIVDSGHPDPEQILRLKDYILKRVILTHDAKPETLIEITALNNSIFEEAVESMWYQV